MFGSTKFGDICTKITEKDLEDIFKDRSNYSNNELEILKTILIELNNHYYESRKKYDKMIQKLMRKYKSHIKKFPSKTELNILYRKLIKSGIIKINYTLKKFMKRKFCRSGSGELPVTVFTSPSNFDCPEDCFYCPDEKEEKEFISKKGRKYIKKVRIQPRSYLSTEPGCMRAARDNFHPVRQTFDRIHSLDIMGHEIDKIRLLILGGTYCFYPMDYRIWFITSLYYACNIYNNWKTSRKMGSLEFEMNLNRDSDVRVVGITIETRPDRCSLEDCAHFMNCGITTVQLGIQQLDDKILKGVNRNCTIQQIKEGTKRILDCGIKLDAHYMFDLPGPGKLCRLSPKQDRDMIDLITKNPDFAVADQWKLYPCSTTPHTKILKWYNNMLDFFKQLKLKISAIKIQNFIRNKMKFSKCIFEQIIDLKKKKYLPYTEIDNEKLIDTLLYALQNVNKDTRLNRVIRDIPNKSIVGGSKITNLRQELHYRIKKYGLKPCECIRCREIQGGKFIINNIKLDIFTRKKAGSNDHFISFEDSCGKIYGLARLRFLNNKSDCLPILKNSAIIRELHVYGATVRTNNKDVDKPQHSGLGKKLIQECEKLSINAGYKKLFVTSGEGVIRYYQKRGYNIIYDEYNGIKYHYMVKNIEQSNIIYIFLTLIIVVLCLYLQKFE